MSKQIRTIKPGTHLQRVATFDTRSADTETRTIELSFSSEQPYERWWGVEILDHTPESVRLDRLRRAGPILMDHNRQDQIGVCESVRIDGLGRVGRAVVRFSQSARASEIYQDILDGIRRNVSVGYLVHKAQLVESEGEVETFRITDWEPMEISIVSIPADTSVGIGRSAADGGDSPVLTFSPETTPETQTETRSMTIAAEPKTPVDAAAIERAAAEKATQRAADILAIGDMFAKQGGQKRAADALRAGVSVEQFRQEMLDHIASQPVPTSDIGMSQKEARQFSFIRAINAIANPGDRKAQEDAAFERECSDAVAEKMGRSARGLFVPSDVQKRDLTVGTAASAGNLVATELHSQSFIDMLRNKMLVQTMGARVLTGLQGNIAIPRQTGGATAYWVAEGAAPTESQQVVDQVTMSPKTVGAYTDVSRKLLLQSSIDVEQFVRDDLSTVLALAIDLAAIAGTGASNQPKGILATSGIGAVVGGADGAALTWEHIVALETAVAVANADVGTMGYLTNAKVRGKLKTTSKVSGQNGFIWEDGGTVNGYRAGVSNQVPSNLAKGSGTNLSAILFGNWADLVIGQWGVLDLMVDPYSQSTSGTVRVVALQDVDVALRNAVSFAAMQDAITA